METELFVKYKAYLSAMMNLLNVQPLPEGEFISLITDANNKVFKGQQGETYRPLTEMEATLVHLDLSLCSQASETIFKAFKNIENLHVGTPRLMRDLPWLALFRNIEPDKIFGNITAAMCHDVYLEAYEKGFVSDDFVYSVCYSIVDDQICFTFFRKEEAPSKTDSTAHLKNLKMNYCAVGRDFDLASWTPSESDMKN